MLLRTFNPFGELWEQRVVRTINYQELWAITGERFTLRLCIVAATVLSVAVEPGDAQFVGWTAGTSGMIVHTSTVGTIWSSQTSGTASELRSIDFVDGNNGWAVGVGGTILHTSNGGGVWSPQASGTVVTLRSVGFVDTNNGWAVGDSGTILHTSNGGFTWSPQNSGIVGFLSGVSFIDALNGWAVGLGGTILHTSDGGFTWLPQTSGIGNDLNAVRFVDTFNGWAVGNFVTILYTSNGGASWSPQPTGGGGLALNSVSFPDTLNGWAVGDLGTILHTGNGGAGWSPQTSGAVGTLRGVSFVDVNNGWIVGDGGTILHTTDGGATWSPQVSGTGSVLFGVSFVKGPVNIAVPDSYQINYLPAQVGGGITGGYIDISNAGELGAAAFGPLAGTTGRICVNVYVLTADEQESECCSCLVTPNALVRLTAADLTGNPGNGTTPALGVVIKLLATIPGATTAVAGVNTQATFTGSACNATLPFTAANLAPGMVAWATKFHNTTPASISLTATQFSNEPLSQGELTKLTNLCQLIVTKQNGAGLCKACSLGGLGSGRR